jgi:hypothetical protein
MMVRPQDPAKLFVNVKAAQAELQEEEQSNEEVSENE